MQTFNWIQFAWLQTYNLYVSLQCVGEFTTAGFANEDKLNVINESTSNSKSLKKLCQFILKTYKI